MPLYSKTGLARERGRTGYNVDFNSMSASMEANLKSQFNFLQGKMLGSISFDHLNEFFSLKKDVGGAIENSPDYKRFMDGGKNILNVKLPQAFETGNLVISKLTEPKDFGRVESILEFSASDKSPLYIRHITPKNEQEKMANIIERTAVLGSLPLDLLERVKSGNKATVINNILVFDDKVGLNEQSNAWHLTWNENSNCIEVEEIPRKISDHMKQAVGASQGFMDKVANFVKDSIEVFFVFEKLR